MRMDSCANGFLTPLLRHQGGGAGGEGFYAERGEGENASSYRLQTCRTSRRVPTLGSVIDQDQLDAYAGVFVDTGGEMTWHDL